MHMKFRQNCWRAKLKWLRCIGYWILLLYNAYSQSGGDSGFCSFWPFLSLSTHDDAVLHCLVQAILSCLWGWFKCAFSSLCQDRQNLQDFTLNKCLCQTLLGSHHITNDDRSAVAQVRYFTEKQCLQDLQPVCGLKTRSRVSSRTDWVYSDGIDGDLLTVMMIRAQSSGCSAVSIASVPEAALLSLSSSSPQ